MASKQTHVFKTTTTLSLYLDIYTRSSSPPRTPHTPIVLYLHGGGFVSHNRLQLPPHIPLVSADYRKLPQTSGAEVFQDVKGAYRFVIEEVPGLLGGTGRAERVVVVGQISGAHWAFLLGHTMMPRPIAILGYHSIPTISDPFFTSSKVVGPKPILQAEIQSFLDESETCGSGPAARIFDPDSLSANLSKNAEYAKPSDGGKPGPGRLVLAFWLLQENKYPELLGGVDRGWEDEGWKAFPETVLVHADRDAVVPYELAEKLGGVVGPTPVKLFTAQGQGHIFDGPLFLGDPGLTVVEEAWVALDEIVESKTQG